MTTISTWINAKLEYVAGAICGASTLILDIPELLVKAIVALALGFLGAAGAGLYKLLESKLQKRKLKK